ncbi:conserved hypothetical protein [Hyphomicrobiales bacterium]|nr:conserved hypothetical protein [Hyphomicrobiales bacterium]CAH1691093.1 conserved hypothetical protein [Hyphomicrobiales bacterium]
MSSLDNALDILTLLSRQRPVLRVNDVSRSLKIPRSSVSRLLQAMMLKGLLERDDNHCYQAGPLALELGNLYRNRFSAVDDADRILVALIDRFQFTGYVSSLRGAEIILLRVRQGSYPLRHVREIGTRLPVFETAMGIALLAGKPESECRALYAAAGDYPGKSSWDDVAAKLDATKGRGLIVMESLLNPGISTIATEVRHHCLEDKICLAIAYPQNAVDDQVEADIASALLEIRENSIPFKTTNSESEITVDDI